MTGRREAPGGTPEVVRIAGGSGTSATLELVRRDGRLLARRVKPGLSTGSAPEPASGRWPRGAERLCGLVLGALRGEPVDVPPELLDLRGLSPFRRRVLMKTAQVPPGRVTTYGALAEAVGRPGGARAVGAALAANPLPLLLPCHRIVRADRTPGGYAGGAAMKLLLLAGEGVGPDDSGRIPAHLVVDPAGRSGVVSG